MSWLKSKKVSFQLCIGILHFLFFYVLNYVFFDVCRYTLLILGNQKSGPLAGMQPGGATM